MQFIPFVKSVEVLCLLSFFLWRLQKMRTTTKTVLRANRQGMIITASGPADSSSEQEVKRRNKFGFRKPKERCAICNAIGVNYLQHMGSEVSLPHP